MVYISSAPLRFRIKCRSPVTASGADSKLNLNTATVRFLSKPVKALNGVECLLTLEPATQLLRRSVPMLEMEVCANCSHSGHSGGSKKLVLTISFAIAGIRILNQNDHRIVNSTFQ